MPTEMVAPDVAWEQAEALERMLYWEQLRVNRMSGADQHGRQREIIKLLSLWRDLIRSVGGRPRLPSWCLSYLHRSDIQALGFRFDGLPVENALHDVQERRP